MKAKSDKAFKYEEGQFICHIYYTITIDDHQVLEDVIRLVQEEQAKRSPSSAVINWTPLYQNDCRTSLHLTLLRGHRAVYYHQIRALISELQLRFKHLSPFSICLDKLVIFKNYEGNKQFLCLAAQFSENNVPLKELKRTLQNTIDQYATKLTSEDETQDTSAHCSLMSRNIEPNAIKSDGDDLGTLNRLFFSELNDFPMCLVLIDSVEVKIGDHVYILKLGD